MRKVSAALGLVVPLLAGGGGASAQGITIAVDSLLTQYRYLRFRGSLELCFRSRLRGEAEIEVETGPVVARLEFALGRFPCLW